MKLDVQTLAAKKSGSVTLDKAVFGCEPRKDILHRMVRYQMAKAPFWYASGSRAQ